MEKNGYSSHLAIWLQMPAKSGSKSLMRIHKPILEGIGDPDQ
jgi:hypothetical protein